MKISIILFLLFVSLLFINCQPTSYQEPNISLDNYQIDEGFELEVVASEPFLEAPVTMDFDDQGRMWVVEMKGYMRNLEGTGSELPNGTISIMEDLDKDGITDHSKIFIDGLVLPRAIAHVYGGLLYAEPPNLWFVEIKNDRPGSKILVDPLYSDGGNVEHQPNGLMMNIDNWIYNAKSNFRYQRKNGKWIKERTSFRGQWGISRDNFGRLYYNNNSVQLIGDYVLPNTVIRNPYYKPQESLNKILTSNQRVYPLHPTSVNRGYIHGILDKDSLLVNVTSSCGPLIYRGDQFPDPYFQNAFVCAPEANIVKRNILTIESDRITAEQAYDDKEFIASTDEGFRPVNLFNGPDGAMYIVDMHRGIIQDKAYLSPYLHKQMADKELDTIVGMGRILRVKNKTKKLSDHPDLEHLNDIELVSLLKSPNAWVRDKAQQLLVHQQTKSAIPLLKELLMDPKEPLAQLHSLYTLKGLDALSFELLEKIALNGDSNIAAHALILLESFASKENTHSMSDLIANLLPKKDGTIDLYLSLSIGSWAKYSNTVFMPFLYQLSNRYENKKVYQEAIISGLQNLETAFSNFLLKQEPTKNNNEIIKTLLAETIENNQNNSKNSLFIHTNVPTDSRTAGYQIYRNLCATCHGFDGEGIVGVAPPLKASEFTEGSSDKLALIILHGLQGPVHVNGKLYELNGVMPGLANNDEYTNRDIFNIISYIHNAFTQNGEKINIERIEELREFKPANGSFYTEEELLKFK